MLTPHGVILLADSGCLWPRMARAVRRCCLVKEIIELVEVDWEVGKIAGVEDVM